MVGRLDHAKMKKIFIGKVHLFSDYSSSYSVNELNTLVEYQCCVCTGTVYYTLYDIASIVLIAFPLSVVR